MELAPFVSLLSALAQTTRLSCYVTLIDEGEKSAGELAVALGVPANTMSSHLAILGTAGMVTSTRNGRSIVYRALTDRIEDLEAFFGELADRS